MVWLVRAGSTGRSPDPGGPPVPTITTIHNITFDANDPWRVAGFWSEVTGRRIHPDNEPGDQEVALPPDQEGLPYLLFVAVPEAKEVKNRVHLDLQPALRTRDEEVERLLGLGATLVADRRNPDGTGWAVLADPEGNEFCVERSAAERAAPS
jgi:predicted enzyme related to lactoylglutathione lyase